MRNPPLTRAGISARASDSVGFNINGPTAARVGMRESLTGTHKYLLVTSIHFNRDKMYVRHVLTHEEYDRGRWKQ